MDNGNLLVIVMTVVVVTEIIGVIVSLKGFTPDVIKLLGLTLISFLGVFTFLTFDPKSENALPAVYGLLGSGFGFLIGKTEKTEE